MTAVLGAACGCGRSIIVSCPTLGEILAARQQMTGWGYDSRGNVRCPDCLGGVEVTAERPSPGEGQLMLALDAEVAR